MTDRLIILSALKRASLREIEVAGVKFHIRGFTGVEREEFITHARAVKEGNAKAMSEAELCSWGMCTPDGERLYADASELRQVDAMSLETIAQGILEASGLGAKKREEIAGESEASPS